MITNISTALAIMFLMSVKSSEAHIIMTKPVARLANLPRNTQDSVKDDSFKGLACGEYFSNGQLIQPAAGTPVQYAAGSELIVEFDETIDHFGQFIVDFAPKLATSNADFQVPVLGTKVDVTTAGVSRASPLKHTIKITLPNITCDVCVLRLRQKMDDQIVGGNSQQYFACADIKLVSAQPPPTQPPPVTPPPPPPSSNDLSSQSANNQKDLPKFSSCGRVESFKTNWMNPKMILDLAVAFVLLQFPLLIAVSLRRRREVP